MSVNILGQEHSYELLNILEFNSTRKRMSVIVRAPSGKISFENLLLILVLLPFVRYYSLTMYKYYCILKVLIPLFMSVSDPTNLMVILQLHTFRYILLYFIYILFLVY